MIHHRAAAVALALLAGCPQAPTEVTSTPPVPPPAAPAEVPPQITEFGEILPDDDRRAVTNAESAEQAAWDALTQRIAGWPRLVPGMLKDDAQRAALEAPFRTDKAAADKLALLTRSLPVYDAGAGHVMRLTGPLARHLDKAGAGLDSFRVDDPRTILWLVLMDPHQVRRTRWLKTKSGWRGADQPGFELPYSRALREAVELAHANRWDDALPRYTHTLRAIAKTNSDRHGAKAQVAWKAVESAWDGDTATLEATLATWWETFRPSKEER